MGLRQTVDSMLKAVGCKTRQHVGGLGWVERGLPNGLQPGASYPQTVVQAAEASPHRRCCAPPMPFSRRHRRRVYAGLRLCALWAHHPRAGGLTASMFPKAAAAARLVAMWCGWSGCLCTLWAHHSRAGGLLLLLLLAHWLVAWLPFLMQGAEQPAVPSCPSGHLPHWHECSLPEPSLLASINPCRSSRRRAASCPPCHHF